MHAYRRIIATTCESSAIGDIRPQLLPERNESHELFRLNDPFHLRKAIVPVLMKGSDGIVRGMGTAFHVDGWGTFLTADHVVESVRRYAQKHSDANGETLSYGQDGDHPFLLLGLGLIYGRVAVPPEAMALVGSIHSLIKERNDPLAALQGKSETKAAFDIAVMCLLDQVPDNLNRSIPVRLSAWHPNVGDSVVAIGFPEIECKEIDPAGMRSLLSEGMFAAYGKIVSIHSKGRGSDETPIIEVEANWPGGMSGGPVFNELGEVVGIVSKSVAPSEDAPGNGAAVCLGLLPWLPECVPSLHADNPGWRRGWAVIQDSPVALGEIRKTIAEATTLLSTRGSGSRLAFVANRIGTDEFCEEVAPGTQPAATITL